MKNTNTFLSYHQLLFPIILTEFLRRASLLPLEHTIEIGQIVEAAVIAHLCNGTRGIYQHTRGKRLKETGVMPTISANEANRISS